MWNCLHVVQLHVATLATASGRCEMLKYHMEFDFYLYRASEVSTITCLYKKVETLVM